MLLFLVFSPFLYQPGSTTAFRSTHLTKPFWNKLMAYWQIQSSNSENVQCCLGQSFVGHPFPPPHSPPGFPLSLWIICLTASATTCARLCRFIFLLHISPSRLGAQKRAVLMHKGKPWPSGCYGLHPCLSRPCWTFELLVDSQTRDFSVRYI